MLSTRAKDWRSKTLVYIDPPYFEKGRFLYHDAYQPEDHKSLASVVCKLKGINWIVSYDDVRPIHGMYEHSSWLQYTLNYSARNKTRGREAMFFSKGLIVPEVPKPLVEIRSRFDEAASTSWKAIFRLQRSIRLGTYFLSFYP